MVEKGLVRFGDLQTMRRVKTWKRLLMKKMRMAAAKEAEKSLPVSPGGGAQTLPHSIYNSLKTFANPCGDAWHEGNFLFLLFVDHVVSTHFLRLYVMLFDVLLKKQGKIAIGPPLYLQLQIWSPYNLIHKFGPPVL